MSEHVQEQEPGPEPEQMQEQKPTIWEAGRHPVNIGQLVMGLAFLGLVAVWALFTTDAVDGGDVRWLLPVPFVLAGAAGLVASAVSGAARRDRWS
ncbi:hypothetical protein [uncultured Nocardioides sp.]|jgi:hypothetical protein|uniref:hypothetical protein n=1 Tax=uncultured Nocardioides sp. TaxID=198441 RepID=UPI000C643E95|nr:hypothetical protein [Nocardioides sp.]|tara:strand:- start:373 stop:657 length:285 start_codon:yes stop_codon:yes gene_type:complete